MSNVAKMDPNSTGVCVYHREKGITEPCEEGECLRVTEMRRARMALKAINLLADNLMDAVMNAGKGFGDALPTSCGSILGTAIAIQGLSATASDETRWTVR
jgi:hypothetical protein